MSTPASQSPVTVIGYGSLMSGLGLTRFGTLPVMAVGRVRLRGCTRGFGKLSMYGDRFAMVLEPDGPATPLRAEPVAPGDRAGDGVEALALTVAMPELVAVAGREGYGADACRTLARAAADAHRGLAAHLQVLLEQAGGEYVAYRRALFEATGYTSPHYIPHPVATGDGPAVVFLPPGPEGSGADDVVPIRVQSAVTRLLSIPEVWRIKPNPDQLDYIAMCLLAEVHGISLHDVYGDLAEKGPLLSRVRARVAAEVAAEPERFRTLFALSAEAYAAGLPPRRLRSLVLPV